MIELELLQLVQKIRTQGCEGQILEVKSAHGGCPERLYDTLSAFSNQDSGGTLVFGLNENQHFKKVGVYDAQDLQKKVMEYGEQMTPVVRPVFTVADENGMVFVSAEIPPTPLEERPCFKTAKGRLKGSYIRVGDADKPMTEYEVYSYEAFRKTLHDDVRILENLTPAALDTEKLQDYLLRRKLNRPNLNVLSDEALCELTGVYRGGALTMTAVLLFGVYPQAIFPQLSILATVVPATELGVLNADGRRFTDSRRIEGTLPEMLEGALSFVRNNMQVATRISPQTGRREDVPQYPMDAVREIVLNALVHRDYSVHTESQPICLTLFTDRLEVSNPGGLYGRLTLDALGQMQPDTRNPTLVTAMESLGQTENRYSGIPRIRRAMQELSLPAPVFKNERGTFLVCLYNRQDTAVLQARLPIDPKGLLPFCQTPRTREELTAYLGIKTFAHINEAYLRPLLEAGLLEMTIPDVPRSRSQRYKTV